MFDEFPNTCSPSEAGFHPTRWERVLSLSREAVTTEITGLAFQVAHRGRTPGHCVFGRQSPEVGAPALRNDAIFLTASLTKPIVAMAVLLLVERGELTLNHPVAEFFPGCPSAWKPMTIRHLLTHTSGLPDMLPDNQAMRMSQSPLSAFREGTLAAALDFPPGRGVQYQSMGFVLLSEIVERIAGCPLREFLKTEIFDPCGMLDTMLGIPDAWFGRETQLLDRIVRVDVPAEQQGGDGWNWNSRYWRQFGAPWGGLFSTPTDLLRFCQVMQNDGRSDTGTVFSPPMVAAATYNQLSAFPDVPESDRRCRGWGYGWRMQWPAHPAAFCDLLTPLAYGHWGATGTLFWIDPEFELAAVLLTPQPLDQSGRVLTRLSNAIVAALGG